jgi:hypothetical protein
VLVLIILAMKLFKRLTAIFCSFALLSASLNNSGCAKEYSYESGPQDTTKIPDSIPTSPPLLASCLLCANSNTVQDSSWSFKLEGASLCGFPDKAIITLERSTFTFFGPSACSGDSGFVASVYLNEPLNSDKTNIAAGRVTFYYYDGVTPSYVLMSRNSDVFSFTIESYVHQTRIATGRFQGNAYTENGIRKAIERGKFKIRFP